MSRTTWEVYRWIRQKRWQKKKGLYHQSFQMVFGKTVTIYTVIFLVAFLFMLNDWLKQYMLLLESWQGMVIEWIWLFPSVLLLRACGQSFTASGILFTSAELKLSRLPHSQKALLYFVAFEKLIKNTVIGLAIALLAGIVTPLSLGFTLSAGILYCLFTVFVTPVQWKLFSANKWKKIFVFLGIVVLLTALRYMSTTFEWNEWTLPLLLTAGVTGWLIVFLPKMTEEIDWMKVADVNDAKVWNMLWISQLTQVHIRPPKRYGLVQTYFRNKNAKKRFKCIESLYHRLWRIHLRASFGYIWKTLLAALALIVVLPIKVDWMVYIGVPIGIAVTVQIFAGIFRDHFNRETLFMVIPVDEEDWIRTYLRWAGCGIIFICAAFLVSRVVAFSLTTGLIIQTIGMIGLSLSELKREVDTAMLKLLRKRIRVVEWPRLAGYVILVAGLWNPWLMVILPVWKMLMNKLLFSNKKPLS